MERIEGLSIGLSMDTLKVESGLKNLNRQFSLVNSEVRNNMSAFDRGERSVGKYETRIDGLNKKMEVQKVRVDAAYKSYEKMVKQHGEGSTEAEKAAIEYNRQASTLKNLESDLTRTTSQLKKFKEEQRISNSPWTKLGTAVDNTGVKLQSLGSSMTDLGTKMTLAITAPIAALAGTAVTKGLSRLIGIDEAKAKLEALGHTTKDVETIMGSALEAVKGTSFGLDEAATTAANAVAAGVEPGKELTKYLTTTGDAAAIAGVSMAEMGSIVNKVQTSGKAYTGELQQLADRGLPVFKWIASEAGVSRDAVSEMASSGQISSELFMKAIESNIGGAAQVMGEKSFTAGLANMWSAVGRLGASFLDAGGEGGGFFSKMKPLISEFTGDIDGMAKYAEEMGVKFGAAFSNVVDKTRAAVNWFKNLDSEKKKLVLTLGAFAVAAGPVILTLGKLASNIGLLLVGIKPVFALIAKSGGLFSALKVAFVALTGPIGITVGVIAALATGFTIAYQKSDTFRGIVHKVKDAFVQAYQKVKEFLTTNPQFLAFIDSVKRGFAAAKDLIMKAFGVAMDFVQEKIGQVKKFWDTEGQSILKAFSNIFNGIWFVVKPIIDGLVTAFKWAFPYMKTIFSTAFEVVLFVAKTIWGNITGVIDGGLKIIMGLAKTFSGLFTGDFSKMWSGIKQLFSGAIQFVWNFVQLTFFGKLLGGAATFIKGFAGFFTTMWSGIRTTFTNVIRWLIDFVKNRFASMQNTISTISNGIRDTISRIWNFIWSGIIQPVIRSIIDFTRGRFTSMRDTIRSIFSAVRDTARNMWNSIKDRIVNPVRDTVSSIRSRFSDMKERIGTIFSDLKKNVGGYISDMVENIKGMPKRMGDGLKKTAGNIGAGLVAVANTMMSKLGDGVNGVIDGVNWVLNVVGVGDKLSNWEVPQYAKGTDGHPGGLAVVGDGKQQELISMPNGQMFMSPATDTLVNLPKGTGVLSGPETKALLDSLPQYKNGSGGFWNNIKSGAGKVWDWTKDTSKKAVDKTVAGVSALKDKASQVWDWAAGGAKSLLDKVLKTMGVVAPSIPGNMGKIAKGAYNTVKDKLIDFVSGNLPEFGGGFGGFSFPAPFRKTSGYGMRWGKLHKGLDFGAPAGTPIPSQSGGRVIYSAFGQRGSGYGGYGNTVHVDAGGGLSFLYAHNLRNLVKKGDAVKKGQTLSTVGNTGDSKGNHLHFEVRQNGKAIDPESFKGGGGSGANGTIKGWISKAIGATGVPMSWLEPLSTIAMKESGGNPRAINNWDINAKRGTPSKGLMQTIDPTFNAHKVKGMGDIYNPTHNAAAAIRYIQSRYGTVFNTPGIKSMAIGGAYRGYATGTNGPLKKSEWAWVGEEGPELMRLNKGTEIFSNKESKDIVSGRSKPIATEAMKLLAIIGKKIKSEPNPNSNRNNNAGNDRTQQMLEELIKATKLLTELVLAKSNPVITPAPINIDGHEISELILNYIDEGLEKYMTANDKNKL